jgi:hypothetical protein
VPGASGTRAVTAEVAAQVRALTDGLSDTNRRRLALLATDIVRGHAAAHGVDLSSGMAPPDRMRAGRTAPGDRR